MLESRESKWYYSRWFILVSLFVILGPLGISLLWRSPRFSKRAKNILTAAVILYTIGIIWAFYTALFAVYESVLRSVGNQSF